MMKQKLYTMFAVGVFLLGMVGCSKDDDLSAIVTDYSGTLANT